LNQVHVFKFGIKTLQVLTLWNIFATDEAIRKASVTGYLLFATKYFLMNWLKRLNNVFLASLILVVLSTCHVSAQTKALKGKQSFKPLDTLVIERVSGIKGKANNG
jgi:hypothetical protein